MRVGGDGDRLGSDAIGVEKTRTGPALSSICPSPLECRGYVAHLCFDDKLTAIEHPATIWTEWDELGGITPNGGVVYMARGVRCLNATV